MGVREAWDTVVEHINECVGASKVGSSSARVIYAAQTGPWPRGTGEAAQ